MSLQLKPGKYVVAVSGGVDSVVLLDMLNSQYGGNKNYKFTVAHFDHGIRADSANDAIFVSSLAKKYKLSFQTERVELGPSASEAAARDARYTFLRRIAQKQRAGAIITAHHQDDLLETMVLNIVRGTGRRGLDPMRATRDITRPLLDVKKATLIDYAAKNNLVWHQDSTNENDAYLRNAIRLKIMPKLETNRSQLLQLNAEAHIRNIEVGGLLKDILAWCTNSDGNLLRARFVTLPHGVAAECMHEWLGDQSVTDLNESLIHKAVITAKTAHPGKKISLNNGIFLVSEATSLKIVHK